MLATPNFSISAWENRIVWLNTASRMSYVTFVLMRVEQYASKLVPQTPNTEINTTIPKKRYKTEGSSRLIPWSIICAIKVGMPSSANAKPNTDTKSRSSSFLYFLVNCQINFIALS